MIRDQLRKLPSAELKTFEGQNEFLMSLRDDPEKREQFESLMEGDTEINYPYANSKPNAAFVAPLFGEVEMENTSATWRDGVKAGKVRKIKAMQMFYCLKDDDKLEKLNMNWTQQITKWLEERYTYNSSFDKFELTVAHKWSKLDRNGAEIVRMIPYLVLCVTFLCFFTGMTTLRGFPPHRSLPWIGPIGVGVSVLGVGSAFGLIGWLKYEIVDLCFAVPILILAVGIDDVFVYTESWRSTKPEWTIRRRTALTMKIAGPGIVVTSFMNSLAFIIGNFFLPMQILFYDCFQFQIRKVHSKPFKCFPMCPFVQQLSISYFK